MQGDATPHGLFRFSGVQLLISLLLLFIAYPFLQDFSWGDYAASALLTFNLLSALLAVGSRRRTLVIGIILILPALGFHWISYWTQLGQDAPVALLSMALAVSYVIFQLLWFVMRASHVDTEVLCAGVSVYLLMGLLWAALYLLVSNTVPDSFAFTAQLPGAVTGTLSFPGAVYFSFSTLTTAGYGDIVPVSHHARSLSSIESVSGVLYIAVLISRLVSLYSQARRAPPSA